jgi:hypothetical protein
MKFLKSKKGNIGLAIALIVSLVALGIVIPIGMWTSSLIFTVIDGLNLGTSGNATRATLETNIWNAYNLSTILPIIAVAGVIIAAITGFVVWRRGE